MYPGFSLDLEVDLPRVCRPRRFPPYTGGCPDPFLIRHPVSMVRLSRYPPEMIWDWMKMIEEAVYAGWFAFPKPTHAERQHLLRMDRTVGNIMDVLQDMSWSMWSRRTAEVTRLRERRSIFQDIEVEPLSDDSGSDHDGRKRRGQRRRSLERHDRREERRRDSPKRIRNSPEPSERRERDRSDRKKKDKYDRDASNSDTDDRDYHGKDKGKGNQGRSRDDDQNRYGKSRGKGGDKQSHPSDDNDYERVSKSRGKRKESRDRRRKSRSPRRERSGRPYKPRRSSSPSPPPKYESDDDDHYTGSGQATPHAFSRVETPKSDRHEASRSPSPLRGRHDHENEKRRSYVPSRSPSSPHRISKPESSRRHNSVKSDKFDPYFALGFDEGKDIPWEMIKARFKVMIAFHHPDNQRGKTDEEKAQSERKAADINRAWDILKTPQRKEIYDKYGFTEIYKIEEKEKEDWQVARPRDHEERREEKKGREEGKRRREEKKGREEGKRRRLQEAE